MTDMLLRLLLGRQPEYETPQGRTAVGEAAGKVGLICNFILAAGKILAGWLAGSVAVTADGVNNLSDAASSVITLIGFRLAKRPADQEHPFGHARYEYVSGLAVASLILAVGVELAKTSLKKILSPAPVEITLLTLAVMGISILMKLWMYGFFRQVGRNTDSGVLAATAADARNDCLTTAAILVSSLTGSRFHLFLDGWAGGVVAVFILISGGQLLVKTLSPLIGTQPEEQRVEAIRCLLLENPEILGIHDLLLHDYGPGRCYASVHAEVRAELTAMEIHEILDSLEDTAANQQGISLVIHADPVALNDREYRELSQKMTQLLKNLDSRLSFHDLHIHRQPENTAELDLAVPYDSPFSQEQLTDAVENALTPWKVIVHFDGIV